MSDQQLAQAAAVARAANIGATGRAARPQKRRSGEELTAPARVGARLRDINVRASSSGATVAFTGVASAYESPYEMYDFWGPYTEIVSAGAGADSLARADLDVPLVLQHADLRRLARTNTPDAPLYLSELDDGLNVDAPELDLADADVAYIVPKLRSGLIDEMSFKFMITSGQWSPDYMEYRINAYDIHRGDVAIVGYGANPGTSGGLRSLTPQQLDELAARLPQELAARMVRQLTRRFPAGHIPAEPAPAPAPTGRSLAQARALLELA